MQLFHLFLDFFEKNAGKFQIARLLIGIEINALYYEGVMIGSTILIVLLTLAEIYSLSS